jgi:hypothetical protein
MLQKYRRRSGRTVAGGLIGGLTVVGLLVVAIAVGSHLISNPFSTRTIDHSPPAVLVNLRDLADYHAAQGQYELTIDQERDVKWLPQAIAGERVQYIAVGTVDAVVDFSHLGADAVTLDTSGKSAVITLPAPVLGTPLLDTTQSHVMNRNRGLLNRIGGMFSDNPTSEHGLELAATAKMADAAQQTGLVAKGETNTRAMLITLLHSLGIQQVDVRFGGVVA